jgi:hypothetical protein
LTAVVEAMESQKSVSAKCYSENDDMLAKNNETIASVRALVRRHDSALLQPLTQFESATRVTLLI